MTTRHTFEPLTPAVFHILFALAAKERHGYGIMKQVEEDSTGTVRMGPGTLYGSLKRMLESGLVREIDPRVDSMMNDERRIYYALTDLGGKALAAELERYKKLLDRAKTKKINGLAYAR